MDRCLAATRGSTASENFAFGANKNPQSRPVAIVGMHRSGTSMVAKLLQRAGLNLGAEGDLMPPAEENPEGFYEHLGFVRLNDEVLNVAGAGWDCPPAAWIRLGRTAALDPFRAHAQHLAASPAGAAPLGLERPAHEPDAAVLAQCVRSFADRLPSFETRSRSSSRSTAATRFRPHLD